MHAMRFHSDARIPRIREVPSTIRQGREEKGKEKREKEKMEAKRSKEKRREAFAYGDSVNLNIVRATGRRKAK